MHPYNICKIQCFNESSLNNFALILSIKLHHRVRENYLKMYILQERIKNFLQIGIQSLSFLNTCSSKELYLV
jgi:hypothetical protein